MSITEIVSIALPIYGGIMGIRNGLMKELASMVGFFIGMYIAWQYYQQSDCGLIMFLLIWLFVPAVLGMAATLVTKILDFTVVGGIMNRILGGLLGVAKWSLLLLCIKFIIDKANEWKTLLETL